MTKKKVKKRRKAPRGSGLSWDPRREKWLWRRVDPLKETKADSEISG